MVELIQIPLADIGKYVEDAFSGDYEFVSKYHFRDASLYDLIKSNIANINELALETDVECYKSCVAGNVIGFVVMAMKGKMLYSFGIKKEYRVKEILMQWAAKIKEKGDCNIVCPLNIENTRAINFFCKNGFEVFNKEDNTVTLLYKCN